MNPINAKLARICVGCLVATVVLAGCASNREAANANMARAAQLNAELSLGYLNQGDLQQAKAKVEKALVQNPRNPLANNLQGVVLQRLNEPSKAGTHFRRAVQLAPDEPEYANAYGVFLCERKQFEEGILQFLDVAENPLYRTPALAYENAANCALQAGKTGIAESNLVRALEIRPRFASAQLSLAKLQADEGRPDDAMDSLQALERYAPSSAESLALGARIARRLGNRDVANSYVRKLQLGFPNSYQAKVLANES
ncbi:MAG: type IV pilus biogenesis/stability protein PilW [Pseudomonadota bacterium]